MHNVVFAFFLLSGFTSLVFEVVWERALSQVFGSTSLALSTLLTAFMSGLALGSWLGGKFSHRVRRPLRMYALLEGGVGLYALAVPAMLVAADGIHAASFGFLEQHPVAFAVLRFATAFGILVVPTTLMGASLPFMSQWLSARERFFQGRVGLLYATNTTGAFFGALLAGFALLPTLGLSSTNTVFACANMCLCVVALAADATFLKSDPDTQQTPTDADEVAALGRSELPEPLPPGSARIIALGFGITGLVSMTYQVLWTRAYVIVLGSSTYSFTLVLSSFLAGLGIGSALASVFISRVRRPLWWLGAVQLGVVMLAATTFAVLDDLPRVIFERMREEIGSVSEIYLFQFFLVGALAFAPIALQGATFPLVVRALVGRPDRAGTDVGRAYAINTLGAIGGSFVAGFVLLPLLGLRVAMIAALAVNLAVALVWSAQALRGTQSRPRRTATAALAVGALIAMLWAPTLDRVALTRGMFRVYSARELFDPRKLANDAPDLVFYEDGANATISVEKRGDLVTLKANGKPEASNGHDMATQILVALLPMMIRSMNADVGGEDVAMVGFGSGVTAGAALQWPLARLDVVEIEPAMLGASRHFDHVNNRPLQDPRTHVVTSDGRNFLEYTNRRYDVIISEPSNPWIAGVASLFTAEHFRRARRRLNPGGVFGQWVQLYEISPDNVRTILATFAGEFEHVAAFSSMPKGTDLILVGSASPIEIGASGFDRAWNDPTVRAELDRADVSSAWDPLGLMFMNDAEVRAFAEGAPRNTDDNGLLEFAAPRDLIRYDVGQKFFQKRYFSTDDYGDPRLHLRGWPKHWTTDQRAELATAVWKAGKRGLADELIGIREPSSEVNRTYWAARDAADIDLDTLVQQAWPSPGSQMHRLVVNAALNDQFLEPMAFLEKDGEPKRGGFQGERGLAYAYILARNKYYRHALEQIEGLENREEVVADSLVHLLVAAEVRMRRRHYEDAVADYELAASLLAETTVRD